MDHNIDIEDARTFVLPITHIIKKRINKILLLRNKLITLVAKLYSIPDTTDKTEICNMISKTISTIETLILKNIDDTQILEYSLAEFTIKNQNPINSTVPVNISEQHCYFA